MVSGGRHAIVGRFVPTAMRLDDFVELNPGRALSVIVETCDVRRRSRACSDRVYSDIRGWGFPAKKTIGERLPPHTIAMITDSRHNAGAADGRARWCDKPPFSTTRQEQVCRDTDVAASSCTGPMGGENETP